MKMADIIRGDYDADLTRGEMAMARARKYANQMYINSPHGSFRRSLAGYKYGLILKSDSIDGRDAHPNEIGVYEEKKRLGIFHLYDTISDFEYHDDNTGFSIMRGDRYFDLHVPPFPRLKYTPGTIRDSLDMVDAYVDLHKTDAKYVLGITYERLALMGLRFGYEISRPPEDTFDSSITEGVIDFYDIYSKGAQMGRDAGPIVLAHKALK